MRRHNRALFRTARAILGEDAEAEDALQEAYLKPYRAIASYRGESRLSSWLARILANEALMRKRKQARRSEIIPLVPGLAADAVNKVEDDSMGSETSAERAELRTLLAARVDALPEVYRTVFVLRTVEEYSAEETAHILQIPEATVRSRLSRAQPLARRPRRRDRPRLGRDLRFRR
jgi:RNA polymerase sigma-70 factor, ECF subfamily